MVEIIATTAMIFSLILAGCSAILLLEMFSFIWPNCHTIRRRNVIGSLISCFVISDLFIVGFHLIYAGGSLYTTNQLKFWIMYSSVFLIIFNMSLNLHMAHKIIKERKKTADVIRQKLESRRLKDEAI